MNAQEILATIAQMKATTAKIIAENPGCKEVSWEIANVPYSIFQDICGHTVKEPFQLSSSERMAIHFFPASDPCNLVIISVPVKIRTVFEEKK